MATNLTFVVSPDGKDARLTLADGKGVELSVNLMADHLLAFIGYLGDARATMIPRISGDTSEWIGSLSVWDPTPEPSNFVVSSLTDGNRILVLRHPGYGWLGYHLSRVHADSMAAMLTMSVENPLSRTDGNA